MKEKTYWVPRFWFPGRENESQVRRDLSDAAGEDCESLMAYAEQHSIDPAQSQNLVESLVEELASKQQRIPASKQIKKPRPYLFTAFVRAVNALHDKEERVQRVAAADLEHLSAVDDWAEKQDRRILVNELVSMMDFATRRTYWRRLEGYSWKEIARKRAMRVNTAIAAYRRGLQRVRETIEKGDGTGRQ